MKTIFFFVSSILLLASCTKKTETPTPSTDTTYICNSTPVAKGSRTFGMDILNTPVGGTYGDNLTSLKSIGGSFQTLHLYWNQIEAAGSGATSGTFSDPYGALASLNALANSDNVKVTLRIHPVDIPGKFVPTDLMNTRFNDANLKNRAKAMLAYVFTKIDAANVTRLMIGNEIDGYNPGSDANFWLDYADFLFDLNAWLQTNHPTVKIGFVSTLGGVTDTTKILANSGSQRSIDVLNAWMGVVDMLGVTYYPLNTSFQMKLNSVVATDFQNLAAFTTKPIHIEEVGYASSATVLGSDDLQADFFCEIFKAWDTSSSKILSVAVLRMNNVTRASAESTAATYGFSGNENFIEYIRTLGVKSETGSAKPAFSTISSELQKRGF
jgi:hypothetical protein